MAASLLIQATPAHTPSIFRQIAASIKAFGFTNPVLIDRNNTIVAGHRRLRAAELLGMAEMPTIRLEGLTADQIRAYVVADNWLAEKGQLGQRDSRDRTSTPNKN